MSASDEAPPKPFEHCLVVFETMKKSSKGVRIEGDHAFVYEGFLTQLFRELGMPTPYYTSVMRNLKAMGCVRQLSRGGGASPSKWELIREPTWELFEVIEEKRIKTNTKAGQLEDMVRILTRRVGDLEDSVETLLEEREKVG
jgi:hypothetical protein